MQPRRTAAALRVMSRGSWVLGSRASELATHDSWLATSRRGSAATGTDIPLVALEPPEAVLSDQVRGLPCQSRLGVWRIEKRILVVGRWSHGAQLVDQGVVVVRGESWRSVQRLSSASKLRFCEGLDCCRCCTHGGVPHGLGA